MGNAASSGDKKLPSCGTTGPAEGVIPRTDPAGAVEFIAEGDAAQLRGEFHREGKGCEVDQRSARGPGPGKGRGAHGTTFERGHSFVAQPFLEAVALVIRH